MIGSPFPWEPRLCVPFPAVLTGERVHEPVSYVIGDSLVFARLFSYSLVRYTVVSGATSSCYVPVNYVLCFCGLTPGGAYIYLSFIMLLVYDLLSS